MNCNRLVLLTLLIFSIMISGCKKPYHDAVVVSGVDSLIDARQYVDAMNLLENLEGDEIQLAIMKSRFALDYYVASLNHRVFSFKNMEVGETVATVRGFANTSTLFMVPVDSMMTELIEKYPSNAELYKTLGDFYYDVHWKYPQWEIPDSLVMEKCIKAYEQAFAHGLEDTQSHHNCGLAHFSNGRPLEGIQHFKKAILNDPDHGSSHYNMAFAYQSLNDFENSTKYALEALRLYSDPTLRADVAQMIGHNYLRINEHENALKYYHVACKLKPSDFPAQSRRLYLSITTGDTIKAFEYSPEFFAVDPSDPNIASRINEIYLNTGLGHQLPKVWGHIKTNYSSNHEIQGNIHFHLASAYWSLDDIISAKEHFNISEKHFLKVYPKEHQVFEAIKESMKGP